MDTSAKRKSKPLFLIYLLVAYVFIQFIWWSYLILDLNKELIEHKRELALLQQTRNAQMQTEEGLKHILRNKWLMILGEGSVFLVLIILGTVKIHRAFKSETALNQQQKNFLLSVTHELKSPIASAKLQLQTLQKRELGKEKRQEIINDAISDVERLDNLVENILLAAKIDNSTYELYKEKINLSEFVSMLLNKVKQMHPERRIQEFIEPDIHLEIDLNSFPSIILNLIENAVKYSAENSPITVDLQKTDNRILLYIKDEGIGIPEEERKFIFKKFYRVGNEETRKTKGTGLGLFIVKYLVEQHSGQILVLDNKPHGSIFKVSFSRTEN